MKNLKNDLKNENYKRAYLFYGEEDYLRSLYEKRASEKIAPADLDVSDGGQYTTELLTRAYSTPPFMSPMRLVICKDTGLFAAGKKDEADKTAELLSSVFAAREAPPAFVIFSEKKVDKRGRLFKTIEKSGGAVEFKTPTEKELVDWAVGMMEKGGCSVSRADAALFVRYAADMNSLELEAKKLIAYKQSGVITTADIELLCVKSADVKVFGLISAMGGFDRARAVGMYRGLLAEKEPPLRILSLMERQFGMILSAKELSGQKMSAAAISAELGLRGFIVDEALRQGGLYSRERLTAACAECLNTDYRIKTGLVSEALGVELLIIRYSGA